MASGSYLRVSGWGPFRLPWERRRVEGAVNRARDMLGHVAEVEARTGQSATPEPFHGEFDAAFEPSTPRSPDHVVVTSTIDSRKLAEDMADEVLSAALGSAMEIKDPSTSSDRVHDWQVAIETTPDRVSALVNHITHNHAMGIHGITFGGDVDMLSLFPLDPVELPGLIVRRPPSEETSRRRPE